jgi:hypothetical protein
MPIQMMRVLPNPYSALDHEGRPSGAFPHEPIGGGSQAPGEDYVRYVCAHREHKVLRQANPNLQLRQLDDYCWKFSMEPENVEATVYYNRAVRSKQILAADADSWVLAGGERAEFTPPMEELARAKHRAVTHWQREYKSDPPALQHWADVHACSAFGSVEAEAANAAAAEAAAKPAPSPAPPAAPAASAQPSAPADPKPVPKSPAK